MNNNSRNDYGKKNIRTNYGESKVSVKIRTPVLIGIPAINLLIDQRGAFQGRRLVTRYDLY